MTNPNPLMPSAPDFLSWQEVEKMIDYLLPQLRGPYDALLMITRGGIVPGGMIAEALDGFNRDLLLKFLGSMNA